jgi:hypothetical protein
MIFRGPLQALHQSFVTKELVIVTVIQRGHYYYFQLTTVTKKPLFAFQVFKANVVTV